MAVPKRRRSKSKKRMNAARWKGNVYVPTLTTCANCKALIKPHRVCSECGFYKGKKVIQVKFKTQKDA
jgi:large subunit ribosomal protein L32